MTLAKRFLSIFLITIVLAINANADDLSCLSAINSINCSDYKLCDQCKTGTIACVSNQPVLTCLECKNHQFLLNGVTYCSTTEGCGLLDKTSGNCLQCSYNYYATYSVKSATDIEIQCTQTQPKLLDLTKQLNALQGYSKNLLFDTKLEILYKYVVQSLGNSKQVEIVKSIWFYSSNIEDCGGNTKSENIYEECQCNDQYYGSRCQLLKTSATSVNTDIKTNIIPTLTDLQTAFNDLVLNTDTFKPEYPYKILFILKTIAEVADGFDVSTYSAFYKLQDSFITAINSKTAYNYQYWMLKNPLTNQKSEDITNWSILYSFYSIFADRASKTFDVDLLKEFNSITTTLTKPDDMLTSVLNNYYKLVINEGFPASIVRYMKATKIEMYFQLINENSNTVTQKLYPSSDNIQDFKFMSLESLSSITCINNPIYYPKFFISKKAYEQIVEQTQPSNVHAYQQIFFVNQYSSNVYQYQDNGVNSPIVQGLFQFGAQSNNDIKALSNYQISLQQDYIAVLIPKFKSHQYKSGVTTSVTCKVLNENTNEWSSSSDLGVYNDKTIECNNHVICFYDLQKNLGNKIKFAYQIDFHTIGPNEDFFDKINGNWWETSGFIISMILIGLFILLIILFLFVPFLNSQNAPKRKIQIQEQELQKNSGRSNNYKATDNIYTDNIDHELKQMQANRMDMSNNLQQQEDQFSNANIVETTEMDANMTLHIYSIIHTTERTYKVQKISILIMNWHFIACFLGIMYKKLTWSDSNIVVGIVYTIIASWFANYIWGFLAVKLRRTVEGSPTVSVFYYILYLFLFIFLFYIELQATEYFYDYPEKQKWHGVGFLLCIIFDYLIFDTVLLFVYQYLSTHKQAFFHTFGSFLRHRGFYQH